MIDPVDKAADLLGDKSAILVFTGAGISTESGIPDFRGPSGVWRTANPDDFTISNYVADPEFRRGAWERRFDSPLRDAEPNDAHRAVVELWEAHLMVGCVTQNIDGLHQAAGLPADALAELHGNRMGIMCIECGRTADADEVEGRWRAGEADPRCSLCGGILKTTTVLFGEMLPVSALAKSATWSAAADAVLVVGSSLSVYPAAGIPLEVASRGAPFVILNRGPTEQDHLADVKLDGRAGEVLPGLVAILTA